MSFGGRVLERQTDGDGWIIALVNREKREIPGTVPPRIASIGLIKRSYPSLFRRQAPGTERRASE